MDRETILSEMRAVTDEYGPWNAYDFELHEGVYTKGGTSTWKVEPRLAHFTQLVGDLAPRPIGELRVLDLACLEGIFALELAKRGAEVVGIEGRRAHVERAVFAARVLELDEVTFLQEDVRALSSEKHGQFDVILCLGILYHLDAPDVFKFLEQLADVCRGFVIIDTHVSLRPKELRAYDGHEYWGRSNREHDPDSTSDERERALRSSLDNPASFWLTKRSLLRRLGDVGFTTSLEYPAPVGVTRHRDRCVLVAFRGSPTTLELVPAGEHIPRSGAWPERDPRRNHRSQDWRERTRIRLARAVPQQLRGVASRVRRRSDG